MGNDLGDFAAVQNEGRRVSSADIKELATGVEDAEEHRGIALHLRMLAKEAIDLLDDSHGIGTNGHAGQRSLEHRRKQRRPEALPGNVGNQNRRAILVKRKYVEVVATNGMTRRVNSGDRKVGKITESARYESLLNFTCDTKLAFPLPDAVQDLVRTRDPRTRTGAPASALAPRPARP